MQNLFIVFSLSLSLYTYIRVPYIPACILSSAVRVIIIPIVSARSVRNDKKKMAYLSNPIVDFEHMQNTTNWEAVQKKRSFVARKMHKINKVSEGILLF